VSLVADADGLFPAARAAPLAARGAAQRRRSRVDKRG